MTEELTPNITIYTIFITYRKTIIYFKSRSICSDVSKIRSRNIFKTKASTVSNKKALVTQNKLFTFF